MADPPMLDLSGITTTRRQRRPQSPVVESPTGRFARPPSPSGSSSRSRSGSSTSTSGSESISEDDSVIGGTDHKRVLLVTVGRDSIENGTIHTIFFNMENPERIICPYNNHTDCAVGSRLDRIRLHHYRCETCGRKYQSVLMG